jgi:hypothetical protein
MPPKGMMKQGVRQYPSRHPNEMIWSKLRLQKPVKTTFVRKWKFGTHFVIPTTSGTSNTKR